MAIEDENGQKIAEIKKRVVGVVRDNFVIKITDEMGLWQLHLMRSILAVPLVGVLAVLGFGRFWPRRWGSVPAKSMSRIRPPWSERLPCVRRPRYSSRDHS